MSDLKKPIRQGDIFRHVPRVDLSLTTLAVMEGDEVREASWQDFESGTETAAVLPIKSVTAIVVTQNCDALRGEYLTLCEVDNFISVLGQTTPTKNPKSWQSLIVTQARANHRLFYLPADEHYSFPEPLVVDFRVVIRVPRKDLEDLKNYRVAQLNDVALDHFRESFSHFFRRYAYNEWYPLTKEEFEAYAGASKEAIAPYRWQR
jgi:hypothetical protein